MNDFDFTNDYFDYYSDFDIYKCWELNCIDNDEDYYEVDNDTGLSESCFYCTGDNENIWSCPLRRKKLFSRKFSFEL